MTTKEELLAKHKQVGELEGLPRVHFTDGAYEVISVDKPRKISHGRTQNHALMCVYCGKEYSFASSVLTHQRHEVEKENKAKEATMG